MANTIVKAAKIEAERKAELVATFAAMTEAQLATELIAVQNEILSMDHDRRVSPSDAMQNRWFDMNYARIRETEMIARAELAARRPAVEAAVDAAPVVAESATKPLGVMAIDPAVINFPVETKAEDAVIRAIRRGYERNAHALLFDIHVQHGRAVARFGVDDAGAYQCQVDAQMTDCTCKAGQARMLCCHVAILADRTGMLDCLVDRFYQRTFPAPVEWTHAPAELVAA